MVRRPSRGYDVRPSIVHIDSDQQSSGQSLSCASLHMPIREEKGMDPAAAIEVSVRLCQGIPKKRCVHTHAKSSGYMPLLVRDCAHLATNVRVHNNPACMHASKPPLGDFDADGNLIVGARHDAHKSAGKCGKFS